ncbi:TonB-dependent receptor [Methyloradius palustris]|uniref:Hemin receptor n=1 Tax=Methyloradius palustris TaxID=2778876 RepID=A0A8D5G1C8_9PROT|nr:TonB-dependent receptor [Methyloradius palustris]BCM23865.1 hemin receptor [Methyloradius palustris]
MKKTTIAGLVGLLFTSNTFAADVDLTSDDVLVSANRFERRDTETTYASEIHTAKDIQASGAATLYDYLAQQTSLNVLSSFGNKATPSINLRGYGGENGSQNVVITVDGQRLNNIDGIPQLLAAIPLGNIDRIEISKGSGSVIYGDGATAGAIQIYTKNKTGVTASVSGGNYGQQNHYINAGISEKYFDLSANAAHDSYDGFSQKDVTGNKDEFTSDTQNVKLKIKPLDNLRFNVEGTSSRNDIRYVNALSLAQFKTDPSQNGGVNPYTHQNLNSDQWRVGVEYDITNNIRINATHYDETKLSSYISDFPSTSNYRYQSNDISINYCDDFKSLIVGFQNFDGKRSSTTDVTTKENQAFFAQGDYKIDALTLSAGARREDVTYANNPVGDTSASGDNNLNAWDIGANYRLGSTLSIFSNYNKSFESPDIDRSFVFDTATSKTIFSGFIKPQEAKTFNIGLNQVLSNNKFKATAFYSWLHDEIYLDHSVGPFGVNTNIDKSHKYGIELQDSLKISENLGASIIYNYTRAIIDSEVETDGTNISNKNLPGVPKHSVVANLNYKFLDHASLNLNQTWRSDAYAYNDFQNNLSQKQNSYQTTNIALNYQYKNVNFFTAINNLFEHENSIQVADNFIYPIDFVRTWRVGMKADF